MFHERIKITSKLMRFHPVEILETSTSHILRSGLRLRLTPHPLHHLHHKLLLYILHLLHELGTLVSLISHLWFRFYILGSRPPTSITSLSHNLYVIHIETKLTMSITIYYDIMDYTYKHAYDT